MLDAFETEKELISVAEFIPGELYRLYGVGVFLVNFTGYIGQGYSW